MKVRGKKMKIEGMRIRRRIIKKKGIILGREV
jgi:hypothetical protein